MSELSQVLGVQLNAGVSEPVESHRHAPDKAKRAFDLAVATTLMLVCLPFMAAIAVLIALQGWPVVFRHQRVGRGGKPFPCLKFRTMVVDSQEALRRHLEADPDAAEEWARTHKLKHDPRITRIGRVLRKTSLDELPQLANVMMGHMSLVGPRPIVPAEAVHYGERIGHYHGVRPGITGNWQVSGRSDTCYRQRVSLDTAYVLGRSLRKDISILFRTVPAVLRSKGSY